MTAVTGEIEARLREIEARAAMAAQKIYGSAKWGVLDSDEGPAAVPHWCVGINGMGHYPIAWVYEKEYADYIASAPSDIAYLLERVRSLDRASVDGVRADILDHPEFARVVLDWWERFYHRASASSWDAGELRKELRALSALSIPRGEVEKP